jgi:DNA primase
VMRFWEAGFHAVATLGNSITPGQCGELASVLLGYGGQRFIAADNDEGGVTDERQLYFPPGDN